MAFDPSEWEVVQGDSAGSDWEVVPDSPTINEQASANEQGQTKSFWQKRLEDVTSFPSAMYNMVSEIPSGISNLAVLPSELYKVGKDAVNLGKKGLFGIPFVPAGADYGRLDRTFKGIGDIAANTAGAIAGPLGMSAASTGYHKILQSLGAEQGTSPEQDADALMRGVIHNTLAVKGLKAAGDVSEIAAKKIPVIANALDRASLGARKGDYGKGSTLQTVETPEGGIETRTKAALDDLLENNKLGNSRNPFELNKAIREQTTKINDQIKSIVKEYDAIDPETGKRVNPPVEVVFENATKRLNSGEVPADLVNDYAARLESLKSAIETKGKGKLEYLQKQKVAFGKSYSALDKVKSAFDRAIYRDLKTSIEKYAPEVEPLNRELSKYIIAEPIIKRGIKAAEADSPLSNLRNLGFTTGGIGASVLTGSTLGGPGGAILGGLFGIGTRVLASPSGQALAARALRTTGGLAGGLANTFEAGGNLFNLNKSAEMTRSLFKARKGSGGTGNDGGGSGNPIWTTVKDPYTSALDRYAKLEKDLNAEDFFLSKKITPSAPKEYADIEKAAIEKFYKEGPNLLENYLKDNTQNGTTIIDTDLARKYVSDSDISQATHEAASALAKAASEKILKDPNRQNVTIVSGAPSVGKSTGRQFIKSDIIFDKIIKSKDAGISLIDDLLAKKKKVDFQLVYARPEEAVRRAWGRALKEGRAVPLEHFVKRPNETTNAAKELIEHYKGNPNVRFYFVENSGEKPVKAGLDEVSKIAYNHSIEDASVLERRLKTIIKEQYENTPKSEKADNLYRQFIGQEIGSRASGRGEPGNNNSQFDQSGRRSEGSGKSEELKFQKLGDQAIPEYQSRFPTVDVDVKKLQLSKDVPNFKANADSSGVVEPLRGDFERRGLAPLQVWQRLNGDLEIISGRHRFDLAKRNNESHVPAQIYKESEGFSAADARRLDAELNIVKERGSIADYSRYFKNSNISHEQAVKRGFLSREKGKVGYEIGTKASDELYSLHQAGKITDLEAQIIAKHAPNNPELQRGGIKAIELGADPHELASIMEDAKSSLANTDSTSEQSDMFGAQNAAIQDAVKRSEIAKAMQKELTRKINAGQNAAKDPTTARSEFGFDIKNAEDALKKVAELKALRERWKNWTKYPEIRAEIMSILKASK